MIFFLTLWTNDEFYKLKSGDSQTLTKLYKTYNKLVYNFLIVKTNGNREVAQDIFSDTFHSALLSVSRLRHNTNLKAWLLQIANRRLIDYFRAENTKKKYQELLQSENPGSHMHDALDALLEKEKTVMFNLALTNIKEKYAYVLTLKYIDKKSVKDIAGKLALKEREVEGLLYRARKKLKKEIENLQRV